MENKRKCSYLQRGRQTTCLKLPSNKSANGYLKGVRKINFRSNLASQIHNTTSDKNDLLLQTSLSISMRYILTMIISKQITWLAST